MIPRSSFLIWAVVPFLVPGALAENGNGYIGIMRTRPGLSHARQCPKELERLST